MVYGDLLVIHLKQSMVEDDRHTARIFLDQHSAWRSETLLIFPFI